MISMVVRKDNLMELNILEHSEFGEIRIIVDGNGNPMFCGSDVATALGYSNGRDAIKRHCRGVVKHDTPISGKIQEINFIYEPDLYRLMIKSKLPSAQEFERWVFEDVLPSLRKYEMYAKDEVLFDEEKFQEMKELLKEERKAALREKSMCHSLMEDKQQLLYHVDQLQLENNYKTLDIKVLEEIVEENQEMVDYAQIIMGSKLDMTPTQIAADYGISAIRLNNLLHEANIQHKVNGQWVLYRKYMNCGYTNSFSGYHEGNDHYYIQTLWTQQGRLLIHRIMTEAGIKPICQTGGRYV